MGFASRSRTLCVLGLLWSLGGAPALADASPNLHLNWRTKTYKLPAMAWRPRAWARPVVVPSKGLVLLSGAAGLSANHTSDGSVRWRWKAHDGLVSTPVVVGEAVYAVSADGQVRAFKVDNGRSLWKAAALRASVRAPITVDAKHIYAVASPGTVFAVGRSSGQIAWRKKVLTSREFLVESRAGALVMGDRVVVGDATGRLSALAGRDGATVWSKTLGADGAGFKDSAHTPVALGADALLAAAHNSGLHKLSAADGAQRWRYAAEGAREPVVHAGVIYVVIGDDELHAVSGAGKRLWRRKMSGTPLGGLVASPFGLFSTGEDGLTMRRYADGLPLARWNDGVGFSGAPAVVGRAVFAMSNAQIAYRLQVHGDPSP